MKRGIMVAGWLALNACGSSSGNSATTELANPCVTKGATYLITFEEQDGGTCGPVPQGVVNVSSTGTVLNGDNFPCASQAQNGCTTQENDCTTTLTGGINCAVTASLTYEDGGAQGTGLEDFVCSGSSFACSSVYHVTEVRQ
jgi:hypothetical protein